jgi:excisionase family DNA binding protein
MLKMAYALTAEDVFLQIKEMPEKERVKLFTLVVNNAFRDQENYSHEEVFGHLRTELFSAEEAANYLEISLPTLRRLVQSQRLKPKQIIGRSQLFGATDLKQIKQQIKKTL